jgi:polyhydroxybutyrate depolymerase
MRPVIVAALLIGALLGLTLGVSPGGAPTASAAACTPSLPHASGSTLETIVSGSVSRQYYLRVPPGYDGTTEVPVVFLFHGHGGSAFVMPYYTKLDTKSDAEGFILVTPQGVSGPDDIAWWNAFNAPDYPNDVIFVNDMLNELESELCIDPQRIFSTGISNGAMMSVRLGCSLSSRIAAIGPVAGVYYPPWSTDITALETCPDTRPVPIIAIHGTGDVTIPFHGGTNPPDHTGLRDIEAAIMPDWATHNGCSTTAAMSTAAPGVRLAENPGCTDNATTLLYVVEDADGPGPSTEGGGHQWPNAALDLSEHGQNTHLIDATDLIWDFFEANPFCSPGPADVDCDLVLNENDNCPTAKNTLQQDADADADGDVCDNCPLWANASQALPLWSVPAGDADCDGFRDNVGAANSAPETYVGADPLLHCAANTGPDNEPSPDAWPVDFNDNRIVNGQDVGKFAPAYGKTVGMGPFGSPPLPGVRFDFSGNGIINGQDIGKFSAYYGKTCA